VAVVSLIPSVMGILANFKDYPQHPPDSAWWAIIFLLTIQLTGVYLYRHHRKCGWFTTSLSVVFTWALINYSYPYIKGYAADVTGNPYSPFSYEGFMITAFYLHIALGTMLAVYLWRFVDSRIISGIESEPSLSPKSLLPYKPTHNQLDVEVCRDVDTRERITITEKDRYLGMLTVGPTGSGKTESVLKPMIWQDLAKLAKGANISITVIEPKGDLIEDVEDYCIHKNIPYTLVDPKRTDSAGFNPLEGPPHQVAETTRTVLTSTFGKQDAFFSRVQQTAARNVILLIKELKGDDVDLEDILETLQSQDTLQQYVSQLEVKKGKTWLTKYFRDELLGVLKDKYYQFAVGIRQQIGDLIGNPLLRDVLVSSKNSINLDEHLKGSSVLLVNTRMGELGTLGDIFGEFMVMHLENAVFRRPGKGQAPPHFFYIDEAPRYVNPDLERLLAIGRSYKNSTIMAIQSGDQFDLAEKIGFKDIALTNCRHKVIFGGLTAKEAMDFEKNLGAVEKMTRQSTYDHRMLVPSILPKSFRNTITVESRFSYTDIMELPGYHMIYRITKNGALRPPGIGKNRMVKMPPPREDFKRTEKDANGEPEQQTVVLTEQPQAAAAGGYEPPNQNVGKSASQEKPQKEEYAQMTLSEATPNTITFIPSTKQKTNNKTQSKKNSHKPKQQERPAKDDTQANSKTQPQRQELKPQIKSDKPKDGFWPE